MHTAFEKLIGRTAVMVLVTLVAISKAANAIGDVPAKPFGAPNFQGEWEGWLCPKDATHDLDRCSVFALVLYESGENLCGVHSFGLPQASRMDEGTAPSVVGRPVGNLVDVRITSGRAEPEVTLKARITRYRRRIHFQLLTFESGDWLLPKDVWLTRVTREHLLSEEATAEVEAACANDR